MPVSKQLSGKLDGRMLSGSGLRGREAIEETGAYERPQYLPGPSSKCSYELCVCLCVCVGRGALSREASANWVACWMVEYYLVQGVKGQGDYRRNVCLRPQYLPVADLRKRALSAAYSEGPSAAFFPSVKIFFPRRNFHFGWPKSNFSGFKRWKAKKISHPTCYAWLEKKCPFPQELNQNFPPILLNFPPFLYIFLSFRGKISLQMSKFPGNQVPEFPIFSRQGYATGALWPTCLHDFSFSFSFSFLFFLFW